jgi:hypothetical protein
MTEHDDLINRARTWTDPDAERDRDAWQALRALVDELADALEARPSLVAESREALIETLREAQKPTLAHTAVNGPGHYVFPTTEQITDALLAPGGPVRLAEDIEREARAVVYAEAAQIVQDVARQGGGLQTAEATLRRQSEREQNDGE